MLRGSGPIKSQKLPLIDIFKNSPRKILCVIYELLSSKVQDKRKKWGKFNPEKKTYEIHFEVFKMEFVHTEESQLSGEFWTILKRMCFTYQLTFWCWFKALWRNSTSFDKCSDESSLNIKLIKFNWKFPVEEFN